MNVSILVNDDAVLQCKCNDGGDKYPTDRSLPSSHQFKSELPTAVICYDAIDGVILKFEENQTHCCRNFRI